MNYEVTATRRRPRGFSAMLGQDFVASALANSIEKGRIAHAYLFCGPRGVGKTSSARILARSLNCKEGPTVYPCGKCSNCLEIIQGVSLDVIEIDGASNTGVSDVREIKDEVLFQPNTGRYKIYIIDEVHMLSVSAFNALLKTIEEPPPYIIFIFATTEIHKVPATIRSRCQQYNFRLINPEIIKNALKEAADELKIRAEEDALFWLAKESGGSMRDAYTLFDQAAAFSEGYITLAKIKEKMGLLGLDELNSAMSLFLREDIGEVLKLADDILSKGVSVEQFLTDLAEYFRNLLLIKSGVTNEAVLGCSLKMFAQDTLDAYSVPRLQAAMTWIFDLYRDIRYSVNPRFELELLLSKLCQLKYWISPQSLVKQVQTLRAELTNEKPSAYEADRFPLSAPAENSKEEIKLSDSQHHIPEASPAPAQDKASLVAQYFDGEIE